MKRLLVNQLSNRRKSYGTQHNYIYSIQRKSFVALLPFLFSALTLLAINLVSYAHVNKIKKQ